MTETIAEALGVTNASAAGGPFGDPNEVLGPTHEKMIALDVIVPDDISRDLKKPEKEDSWADYEYSRRVAQNNLEQAQRALKSAVEFVNTEPSSRAYEVLGNFIKIVNDCSTMLLDIQKKMKDVMKPEPAPKGTGVAVVAPSGEVVPTVIHEQTNVLIGNPSDALKYLEKLRKGESIPVVAEVLPDGG